MYMSRFVAMFMRNIVINTVFFLGGYIFPCIFPGGWHRWPPLYLIHTVVILILSTKQSTHPRNTSLIVDLCFFEVPCLLGHLKGDEGIVTSSCTRIRSEKKKKTIHKAQMDQPCCGFTSHQVKNLPKESGPSLWYPKKVVHPSYCSVAKKNDC